MASKEQREIERKVDALIDSLLEEGASAQATEPESAGAPAAEAPPSLPRPPLPKPIREPAVQAIPTFEIPKASWSMDTEDDDDVTRLLLCAGAILTL